MAGRTTFSFFFLLFSVRKAEKGRANFRLNLDDLLTPFSRLRGGCGGGGRASERCGAPIAAEETRADAPRSGLPPPCVRGASGARARGGAPAGACFERTVCVRARAAAPCAQNRGAGRRLRGPIEAPQSARRGRAACGGIAARLPA